VSSKINQYTHSDELGSYTVCFGDRTIEVIFTGVMSEPLIEKYCADLKLMLNVIEWRYWGYYGDLTNSENQSLETNEQLIKLHKRCLENGCVVDAYTIVDPVAKAQVTKTRLASGVKAQSIDKNLFLNRREAIDFIHGILLKVENKH
jgi:hypothetical protein